jgi:antitoxin component YwqK of YwqJK toxin-antitoxin module
MRTARCVLAAAWAVLWLAGAPAPAPAAEEEREAGLEVIDTSTVDAVPERTRGRVALFLKELPAGTRVRVTLGRFFDSGHSSSRDTMEPYVYTMVPLDKDGKPHGDEEFMAPRDGVAHRIVPWKNGVKDGIEKVFERDPAIQGLYVDTEIPWKAGVVEGTRRTFFPGGRVRTESAYRMGLADGPSTTYDEAGNVVRTSSMKEGRRDGDMIDYWPGTQQVKRSVSYNDGLVEGVAKEFYADGSLKHETPFRGDRMHGVERQYEPDGTVIRTRYWRHGDSITQAEYEAE